jgi:disulfide oxidoreductase YuzD
MAINKSIFFKLSGQLNKELVFKQYGDKTVVSKYPDMSKRVLSPKQKQVHERMQEANYVVKAILADEEQSKAAQVRLNVTRNKLYTALIKEYFKNNAEGKTP